MRRQRSLNSFRGSSGILYVGTIFVVLGVAILSLLTLWNLRNEALARVSTITQNLSKSTEQSVEAMIENVDQALQVTVDEITRQFSSGHPNEASINGFLVRQQEIFPQLDLLRATNPQGETIYGKGVDPTQKASLAQRDYYKRLRDDPTLGMVISEPIIGKISQKWIWLMARRLNSPDGSFAGLAYGSIFIEDLVQQFQAINMNPGSTISLRDENMTLVARTSFDTTQPLPIGSRNISQPFQVALALNRYSGSFDSAIDGVRRLYSYQRNPKYGFTVLVGIPMDAALAEWSRQATTMFILLLVFVVGSLSFARSARRAWQQEEKTLVDLSQTQSAMEKAGIGVHWVNADSGKFIYTNHRAAEILGYTVEEMLDLVVPDIDPNFKSADFRQATLALRQQETVRFESINLRKDGSIVPVDILCYFRPADTKASARFITFLVDISQRKVAEQALLEAERKYHTVADFTYDWETWMRVGRD